MTEREIVEFDGDITMNLFGPNGVRSITIRAEQPTMDVAIGEQVLFTVVSIERGSQ
jgi:hypothetical protein